MSNDEVPNYLRHVIEDGEVILDEEAKTAPINIDAGAYDPKTTPEGP